MPSRSSRPERCARLAGGALVALASMAALQGCSSPSPVPPPPVPAHGEPVPVPDDPARGFDFWLGTWDVQNLLLRGGRWQEAGGATARVRPALDGAALLEQWEGTLRGDRLVGFSLRAWDPDLGKWVVWLNWHQGRPGGFYLMYGYPREDRIEMFPPEDLVQVRYTFSDARTESCRWASATSDQGVDWTTDWVMQFTRREPPRPVHATNAPVRRPPESAAGVEDARRLDHLIGVWSGPVREVLADGGWREGTATARVGSMIDGLGMLQWLDTDSGYRSLAAMGPDPDAGAWVAVRADTLRPGIDRLTGVFDDGGVAFTGPSAGAMLREGWSACDGETCVYDRSRSDDEGATWRTVLTATLHRQPG